ncbi:hypothetical protein [Legionella sp. 227]|uniref:hypothetical protein n=1 Tax=Legionella sp. 227 TaxID=3367288 RepID=UPI00370DD04B
MIILYIPFCEENDLIASAIYWQKVLNTQNLLIIQHGKKINYQSMMKESLTIYVLAHGIDYLLEQFHLASTFPTTAQTTLLSIDKIAERFNSDFLYLHHRIRSIKLYFCNNKGNQKSIAEKFHQNLILFNAFIDYYAGTLFSPSTDKKKYSCHNGQRLPASKVRQTLDKSRRDEDSPERMNIKQLSKADFIDETKQKNLEFMIQRQKKVRQELFMNKRNIRLKHPVDSEPRSVNPF